jgi:hypothetical protein
MTIALLGWGSLIWDPNPVFDVLHGVWEFDGPRLPLEFSRISASRQSALTLAIDKLHGAPCTVAWCRSLRVTVPEAVRDLITREKAKADGIRHLPCDAALPATAPSIDVTIATWARSKGISDVVWTGLASNFTKATGKPFTVSSAMAHIKSLPEAGKRAAYEYVTQAPPFVRTPVQSALLGARWFKDLGS